LKSYCQRRICESFKKRIKKQKRPDGEQSKDLMLARVRSRSTQSPLYRSNSTALANVLTSPSVHHHVHVC
jgi:hypothetical protein